mgnify:FL=1
MRHEAANECGRRSTQCKDKRIERQRITIAHEIFLNNEVANGRNGCKTEMGLFAANVLDCIVSYAQGRNSLIYSC